MEVFEAAYMLTISMLEEARGISSTFRDEELVRKFREGKRLSSTRNEDDLVLDFYKEDEQVCLARPRGVVHEATYM